MFRRLEQGFRVTTHVNAGRLRNMRTAATEDVPQWRKVEWTSRADFVASLVSEPHTDGILRVGTHEVTRLCSPLRDYRRSHGKT
jgi:hypothetical protein